MVDGLVENLIPGGLVRLSKNGWINTHFHASHLSPQILKLAAKNEVHIGTFPSHNTHLLQPLDVGLYKPLKNNWKEALGAI
ncbi:hypothetical protein PR048_010227 [Dryococelus australis]|uniref:DDE-1 domain-containing protein n=1 Tax=Dryococelus australis TaxID=614101 RepID=A0ABQ9I260_9NEOP|nr:hypothetical protein PR048_010227 [Dryococelus australis]